MVNISRWKVGEGHLKIFVRKHEGQRNLNKDKKILKLAGHRIHKPTNQVLSSDFFHNPGKTDWPATSSFPESSSEGSKNGALEQN